MGMVKQNAYERLTCLVCGRVVAHKPTGRPRKYCSSQCKQKDYRTLRKWAGQAVDAALRGEPEPPKTWRADQGQGVTKVPRSGKEA